MWFDKKVSLFLCLSSEKVYLRCVIRQKKCVLCLIIRQKKCVLCLIIRQKKCELWKEVSIRNGTIPSYINKSYHSPPYGGGAGGGAFRGNGLFGVGLSVAFYVHDVLLILNHLHHSDVRLEQLCEHHFVRLSHNFVRLSHYT